MMYVIQCVGDGAFVADSGLQTGSYTNKLQNARAWLTREQAERDCCGNERVIPVDDLFRREVWTR